MSSKLEEAELAVLEAAERWFWACKPDSWTRDEAVVNWQSRFLTSKSPPLDAEWEVRHMVARLIKARAETK